VKNIKDHSGGGIHNLLLCVINSISGMVQYTADTMNSVTGSVANNQI